MTTDESVWTKYVSARQARAVGSALRAAGYRITNEQVVDLGYAINIGRYLEPGSASERAKVSSIVCQAAGFQPRRMD